MWVGGQVPIEVKTKEYRAHVRTDIILLSVTYVLFFVSPTSPLSDPYLAPPSNLSQMDTYDTAIIII